MSGTLAVVLYLAAAALLASAAAFVGRRIPIRNLALFAALPLAFFFPDLARDRTHLPTDQTVLSQASSERAGPKNPWLNDVATQFLPWAVKVRRAWSAGELPFRDPSNGCGSALAASGITGAFSPLTFLGLPLPLTRAMGLAAALSVLAALLGMWLWLRELGVSPGGAVFGAVSFALSFAIVPWLFFPQAPTIAAWPWVFFAVERLRGTGDRGRVFGLLVATLALWPLFGHLESVASGAALVFVVTLLRWATGDLAKDGARLVSRLALAGVLAIGLDAFALVPQTLAILSSNRRALVETPLYASFFSWMPHGPLWPAWRSTLFPQAFGDGIRSPTLPVVWGAFTETALGYIGILGWALALLVLRPGSRRARTTWALALAILIGYGIGSGAWPFTEIAGHLPLFRWMTPVRVLAWIALAAAALAALELDRLLRDASDRPLPSLFSAVAVGVLLALLAGATLRYYVAAGTPPGYPAQVAALERTLWLLGAFAAVALLATRSALARRAAPYVLAAASVAELGLHAATQYVVGPASGVYPQTPLAAFLERQTGDFRIAGEGWEFFPQRNAVVGVEDIRTHDPVERRDYVEFLDAACGYPPADYFKSLGRIDSPALDFLNVRTLVSYPDRGAPGGKWTRAYGGADGSAFRNTDVLPRVFAPVRLVPVPGRAPRGWIPSSTPLFRSVAPAPARLADYRQTAFVLGESPPERPNGAAEIGLYRESQNAARFHVRARGGSPETLLATSLVQDGGWRARTAAGAPLRTTLVDGPFLALWVPDGEHDVVLAYAPPGLAAGLAASVGTALAAVLAAALQARRGRAPSPR